MKRTTIVQTDLEPDFIDLGMGNPGFDLLPINMLERAAAACFAERDTRILQYGAEQGNGYFRIALAAFLSRRYDSRVDPDLLFVTAGVSSALDLICTLHTQPGDVVFVEEPTYFLALRVFADHGLRVVSIPVDKDGMQIDVLEENLKQLCPKLVYTVPVFQNPSGVTLSIDRRARLLRLAQQYDFLIVSDEVYQFLDYSESPPAPAHAERQLISLNSFSKILAPGLRLGWIQAHPKRISELAGSGLLDSGGGMNPFTSAIVRFAIENGDLDRNLENLRSVYTRRLQVMDNALRRFIPQAEFVAPAGGFFFWVRLPGLNASALRDAARAARVDFRPGSMFSSAGGLHEYMRLSYCFFDEEQLETGIQRLATVLKNNRAG